jgi:UDP-GlcNAc:undecaprenyl-phosphate/decaprenyl-phosphate GlcNAc-1-phosphate transferase
MNNFIFLSIIINILLITFYKRITQLINIYDIPDKKRKIHNTITPIYGGVIIIVNLLIFLYFSFFDNSHHFNQSDYFENKYNLLIFFFASFSLFLLGLYDDKKNLTPNIKISIMIAILLIFLNLDDSLLINEIRFSFVENIISLGKFSYLFTILCFLLLINACNMFDGINLQSSVYFLIFTTALLSFKTLDPFYIFIFLSLISIITLNTKGKIFIGDGGILLISFILGYISIKFYNLNYIANSDSIFILMMIPGFDLLRLFFERLSKHKHPFAPDQLHIHHLLLKKYSYIKTQIFLLLIVGFPIFLMMMKINLLLIICCSLISYIIIFLSILKK